MREKISGIYAIIHKPTGNLYVGQSKNINQRFYQHKYHLNKGTHYNPQLQKVWNDFGEGYFSFVILEECSPKNLNKREEYWLHLLPRKALYNETLDPRYVPKNTKRKRKY